MDILQNIGVFLINTLLSLYISIVIIRFLLALSRADFYNQLSQFIVKVTNPVLIPLRRIIPSIGKLDTALVVLALSLIFIKTILIALLTGEAINLIGFMLYSVFELLRSIIWIYIIALFIQSILSWVANGTSNPLTGLIYSLTNPVLRPLRRRLPMLEGIDFSPMAAILGFYILLIIINGIGI
jgi:YggT family protein